MHVHVSSYGGAATLGNTVSAAGPLTLTGVIPCFDHSMLTCLEVRGRLPSYRRVTSIPDRDAFEKYCDATPTCLAMLLQKYALLLVEISGYTTDVYEMHLPCVSWCFCTSIRGCQGSLAHSLAYVAQIVWCNHYVRCNSIRTPPPSCQLAMWKSLILLSDHRNGRRAPAQILWWWLAMRNIGVVLRSTDAKCLRFGLSLLFGLRCERPRCKIASDAGRAMRATKLPSALVSKQSVNMSLDSRKQIVIDLLTNLWATIVENTFKDKCFALRRACSSSSCVPAPHAMAISKKHQSPEASPNMRPAPSQGIWSMQRRNNSRRSET